MSKFYEPPTLLPGFYESWKKEISFWRASTTLNISRQAPTVFLSLTGQARDAIREMDVSSLTNENGMDRLIEKLDSLFLEDASQSAFMTYENFESFSRETTVPMNDYLISFDRHVARLKEYNIILPEPVLAYRALKSASLSSETEKLVRATISDLTLSAMTTQLKKITFTDFKKKTETSVPIKIDPSSTTREANKEEETAEKNDVLYARSSYRKSNETANNSGHFRKPFKGKYTNGRFSNPDRSACYVCGCKFHFANQCPYSQPKSSSNRAEKKNRKTHNAGVFVNDVDSEDEAVTNVVLFNKEKPHVPTFISETINSAVLDSGASATVCGLGWFNCYMETLTEQNKKNMSIQPGTKTFKFGDGAKVKSIKQVMLPCVVAGVDVYIVTDVVEAEIPLLLSRGAMKKAGTSINFNNDTAVMLGKKVLLNCTSSGHYYIPISRPPPDRGKLRHIFFLNKIDKKTKAEKLKIATKLHRQFSHPSAKKLCDLVKSTGLRDTEFFEILNDLPLSCETCIRYKKNMPRPIVGFSLGTHFNQTVAMDIKEIKGHKVLHLVDHATRYSVGVRLPSKDSSDILSAIFKHWIAYFGTPGAFLTDNGREFDNQFFRDMAENLNIIVRTTAAQSPWSNGLNERHNGVLGEMVQKTLEDVKCNFEVALAWAVSAKNALHNAHGYSPNQLVFGKNPNLPSLLNDKLPALEGVSTSEIVANNLNAMHAARKSFIESEASEKLRRALRHQVRTSLADSYKNGDLVLYKRNESDRWRGPGTVIGWEHKQVLVKHGGTYVRVHPCRLTLYPNQQTFSEKTDTNEDIEPPNQDSETTQLPAPVYDETDMHSDLERTQPDNIDTPPNTAKKSITLPKPGQTILCKLQNDVDQEWRRLRVISRAGKASGRNRNLMNVAMEQGEPFWMDFEYGVLEWREEVQPPTDESEDEQSSTGEVNVIAVCASNPLDQAKKRELQSWIENKVYTQVPDQGQTKIYTRWVYTNRISNGEQTIKARLVAKGFQDKDADTIRKDSPTCAKESLRIVLGIVASCGWTCKSMDIKTAFLQSKQLDRPVYLSPPKEASVPPGHIWKLSKCVYGLTDASRSWYLTLREKLIELGATVSKYDQAIFTWYNKDKLQGVIATHVDDFCFAGSDTFEAQVINNLRTLFKVRSEAIGDFRYVGLEIKTNGKSIRLGQDEYVKELKHIPMQNGRSLDDKMSPNEITEARQLIGKLNWLATQTRPDLSYDVSSLSSVLRQENVACMKHINRTIKKAKKEKSQIHIPNLGNPKDFQIVAYSDASFANLMDGGSQGGYIIFLVGENSKYIPVAWQSKRIKRVVKSTLAAETLALVDLAEACLFFRKLLLELLQLEDYPTNLRIFCKTDNSCLYDAVHSSTQILDKRLRIEMAILRELVDKDEITEISWIPTERQIADALTKKGVPSFKILGYTSEIRESPIQV